MTLPCCVTLKLKFPSNTNSLAFLKLGVYLRLVVLLLPLEVVNAYLDILVLRPDLRVLQLHVLDRVLQLNLLVLECAYVYVLLLLV